MVASNNSVVTFNANFLLSSDAVHHIVECVDVCMCTVNLLIVVVRCTMYIVYMC